MLPCSRPNGIRINLKSTLMKNLKLFRAAGTGARWLFVVCFTLFCCQSLCAQSPNNADHACTVRILDDDGNPVSGAAVVVKGSNTGEISDAKGFVRFRNIPRNATLLVTYLGMDNREEPVNGRSAFDIKLSQGSLVMDELVVVGYGVQRKRDLSGAVAQVKGDLINEFANVSVAQALQGRVSGVQINQLNGQPGAAIQVRIRGANSIKGDNEPLWIINGFPGNINMINTSDIESVEILKDASATAIYGSRAANGVILITTKTGYEGSAKITYSGNFSFEKVAKRLNLVTDYADFMEIQNAALSANGQAPRFSQTSIDAWRNDNGANPTVYPNTDWQDAVLTGSGLSHSHTVSLGIGSERVRMLTTLGYVDQNGIIETTDFQRYTFRNNADVKFNDKLSMKLDLSFSNGDRRSSPYQGTIFNYMNTRSADIPNQFSTGLYNGLGLQGNNPVALMLEGGQNKNNTLRLSGAITLTYEPVEWLSLQGMLAPRYATTNKHNWKKPVTTYQDMEGTATLTSTPYATLTESGSRAFYGNYNFLMTFKKNFSGHDLKLILGAERNTYDYKYLSAYRQVFNYPDYDQIDVGEIENMDNSGHRYEWAIQSYFGRLNYNFKERYLLEANLRIDGSSRFSKSNRWGYFPSVSGAWRISEEPFMENAKHILDGLKIRASYGTLGNQNLAGGDAASYYPTTPNLALGHISMNGTPASLVTLNTLANPDIKWETTTMLDVGVDVTLFSKLNITADWYRKNTDDILMKLDIPAGVGLNAPYQNAGKVRNTGWELSIGYNNRWRDFTFGVQANVSDVKNEIVDMRGKTATSGVLRNQEGYSIGSIYALESLGIIRTQEEADWVNANCPQFKETVQIGDIRYADIDGSNTIDENDKTIVGSTIPRYTYSLNLDFGWKGLRLSMLFQGVGKTDGYLNTYYVMPSNQGGTFRKEHIDFACAANPGGVTPRLTSANKNNWYDSSFWMKSAAYLRLKNIQLGYDLPKSWMRKIGLKSAYVYVNAQNLFTATNFWDGYDPEVGYDGDASGDFDLVKLGSANNYPQVKLVTIGLDLKF